jgi:hypothetical protein
MKSTIFWDVTPLVEVKPISISYARTKLITINCNFQLIILECFIYLYVYLLFIYLGAHSSTVGRNIMLTFDSNQVTRRSPTENIRYSNLTVVKYMTIQVINLVLQPELPLIGHNLLYEPGLKDA